MVIGELRFTFIITAAPGVKFLYSRVNLKRFLLILNRKCKLICNLTVVKVNNYTLWSFALQNQIIFCLALYLYLQFKSQNITDILIWAFSLSLSQVSSWIKISFKKMIAHLSLVTTLHRLHLNSQWKVDWKRCSTQESIVRRRGIANTGVSIWPGGQKEQTHNEAKASLA